MITIKRTYSSDNYFNNKYDDQTHSICAKIKCVEPPRDQNSTLFYYWPSDSNTLSGRKAEREAAAAAQNKQTVYHTRSRSSLSVLLLLLLLPYITFIKLHQVVILYIPYYSMYA